MTTQRKNTKASEMGDDLRITKNRGLVVSLPNGQEFQITIVESTRRC